MTLQKLAAGSRYEYLTQQVAALDSTEKGSIPLADYYSAKGEAPGRWVGSGLAAIDGMEPGDIVTAEQMKHLFDGGCDPVSGGRWGRRTRSTSTRPSTPSMAGSTNSSRAPPNRRRLSGPAAARATAGREFFVAETDENPRRRVNSRRRRRDTRGRGRQPWRAST